MKAIVCTKREHRKRRNAQFTRFRVYKNETPQERSCSDTVSKIY
jgi:hypothetical protein